ncbi:unnamed protein product [Diatraea saccharalis]|uniref:Ionotropic glutamate receptor C-terminal domain-containing protein n=1 Tax=Diatraea saccharalis TaxID=40085 RepID=A0A9N9RE46_9NEOP|nr:unnamed protein product [Diatraea saccharalis]
MLNATPRYIFSHRWGYKQNGRWSGMINDLHTGKADLGKPLYCKSSPMHLTYVIKAVMINVNSKLPTIVRFRVNRHARILKGTLWKPMRLTYVFYDLTTGTNCLVKDKERLDVVSYTDMMAPFRVRFVFRQPPLSYVSNIYSLPFSTAVWVAILICTAVSTATLYVESKWENTVTKSATQLNGSFGDALLLTMSAVGQQGCVLEPQKYSGRMAAWISFATLMLLYAAYSANIVVLLQAPSNSIRNLAQLADSSITIAANDVDYNHFVFSQYNDPVRMKIYKKIDPEKGKRQFYDIKDGVERIRQGLFAFHSIVEPVYRRIEETFMENEKCDLQEVDFLNGFDPFIPVKKDSPYLELLRVTFKQIRESGIQSAVVGRSHVHRPLCGVGRGGAAFTSAGLRDLSPVLILMLYGTCAALVALLLEHAVSRRY